MYYSAFKSQISIGEQSELKFKETALKQGFKVKKSTKTQNRCHHIDFFITKDGNTKSVDVKTIGKYGVTAEIQNNKGGLGSLLGQQDYLAYVDNKFIYIVDRKELLELVKEKIINKDDIHNSNEAAYISNPFYIIFQRKDFNWNDMWIMIDRLDLYKLVKMKWEI